jgi:tetratricopeptide (TPR) repeat protein
MRILIIIFFTGIVLSVHAQKVAEIQTWYTTNQFQKTLDACNNGLNSGKSTYDIWYYKGLSELALYRFNDAVISLNQAVKLSDDKTGILFTLANACEQAGNYEQALATYQSILQIDSLHIPAKARIAKVYLNQKEYLKAMDYYSQLVKQDTNNAYFYSELAYCCDKMGLKEPSISFYLQTITLNPLDLKSANELIQNFIDEKHYSKAFAFIDTFLIRFPDNIRLLKQQAYLSAIGGNYLDAVRQFQHIVNLGDTSLFTSKYYGQSLYNNGQYPEAIVWLKRYLYLQPSDSRNQFILGMAYQKDYKYIQSQMHLEMALTQLYDKAMFARIFEEKATTFLMHGDYIGFRDSTGLKKAEYYQNAINCYLEALDLTPDDYTIYRALGLAYETKFNDLKLALYYYELYYKKLDSKKITEDELDWIQKKIAHLKEEMHFIGDE